MIPLINTLVLKGILILGNSSNRFCTGGSISNVVEVSKAPSVSKPKAIPEATIEPINKIKPAWRKYFVILHDPNLA